MKTWAQVTIGVTVSCVVAAAIIVPCVLLIPADETTKPTYTFDDLYSNDFNYNSLYPTWDKTDTTGKLYITTNDDKAIVTRDVTKSKVDVDVLINANGDNKGTAYWVSADNQFVYYRYNRQKVWRHSYTADFAIYKIDPSNKDGIPVSITGFPSDGMIHHMEWSPTGHKLAYVYKWNVYVISNLDATTPTITTVTTDGKQNEVYNGIPDWVYEEEMVGTNNVLYWNTDSTAFAYLKTDETGVNIIEYSMYNDGQYPETIKIAYPKAGTTNPTVQMFVYDLTDAKSDPINPVAWPTGDFNEVYFSRFTWRDDSTFLITWINRNQTHSVGNFCTKTTSWDCTSSVANEEDMNGESWVGSFGPFDIVWKDTTDDYFTIYARPDDNPEDGRWQIAYIKKSVGSSFTWLTKTNYDIVGLNFYDNANDFLYFTAAAPLPRQRHIYRVKSDAADNTAPECMTCYLINKYANRCGWLSPVFNNDQSLVVVNCRGYWVPMTVNIEIGNDGAWGDETIIEDNQDLENKVNGMKWPTKEYGEFKSDKYSKEYKYEIFKPSDFDENKKYPLLIEVYAGPEFQSITDVWTRGWATTHMVSDKDIVVASVDGRGSAYEGYKFMRQVYQKLGQYEPVDQTDFAKWLAGKDWIDETKVAIWGWSYGGYTTSHTLGYDGGNTFKCGIAVAPLADWRFYDSMYAERYMGWPDNNEDGYDKASIVKGHDLDNFKKAEYVLIHGTADDNVHFQNAAEMEKALVEADVDFDDFFYADQAHSINIGNANKHIYRQLTIRMSYCLGRSDQPYP